MSKNQKGFSKVKWNPCDNLCKLHWETGRGTFIGYRLLICKEHQIIHKMEKINEKTES